MTVPLLVFAIALATVLLRLGSVMAHRPTWLPYAPGVPVSKLTAHHR